MSTNVVFPTDHTPEEWRELARESWRRRNESWERSDTDGFLSQWANEQLASHYEDVAQVAEAGGKFDFTALTDLDGNWIDARYVETRYGWSWVWDDADGTTHWFRESSARSGERRRKYAESKGVRVVLKRQDAVYVWGSGPGSGWQPKQGTTGEHAGEIAYPDW